MVSDGDFVAIFNSIHRVLKAEKVLKAQKLHILLIPVPRTLSSDCGLAIRYPAAERDAVLAVFDAEALHPEETHVKVGEEYRKVGE